MDDFECQTCRQKYSHNLMIKMPRKLRCGHTICNECSMRLKFNGFVTDKINCPICRKDDFIYELDELNTNKYIVEAMKKQEMEENMDVDKDKNDEWSEIRKLKKPCEMNHRHIAVETCKTCNLNLCRRCLTKTPAHLNHHLQKITEEPKKMYKCQSHPEEKAEYVTEEDGQVYTICFKCSNIIENKGFSVRKIDEKNEQIFESLHRMLEWTREQEENLKNYQVSTKNALLTYNPKSEQYREAKKLIKTYSGHAEYRFEKSVQFEMNELEDGELFEEIAKKAEKKKKIIEKSKKELEQIENELKFLKSNNKEKTLIVQEATKLMEKLQLMKIVKDDFVPLREYKLCFRQRKFDTPDLTMFQIPKNFGFFSSYGSMCFNEFDEMTFKDCYENDYNDESSTLKIFDGKLYKRCWQIEFEEIPEEEFDNLHVFYCLQANNMEDFEKGMENIGKILSYDVMKNGKLVIAISTYREKREPTEEYKRMVEEFVKTDGRLSAIYFDCEDKQKQPKEAFENFLKNII